MTGLTHARPVATLDASKEHKIQINLWLIPTIKISLSLINGPDRD
jgi:hypothetical protein